MPKRKIIHRGKYYERTKSEHSKLEKAFSDQWEVENTRITGGGVCLSLLCTRIANPGESTMFWDNRIQVKPLTQDMATDAATIIQWLGSNVGFCFLEMALDRAGMKIVRKEATDAK